MWSSNQQPKRLNFAQNPKLSTNPCYFYSNAIWSGGWGIHKEELGNSQCSFKSSKDCLDMYSDGGEKTRYTYRILAQKPLGDSHSEDREMDRKIILKGSYGNML
jgi:hypothetical protein